MNASNVHQNLTMNSFQLTPFFFSKLRNQIPLEAVYKKFKNILPNGYTDKDALREMK